MRNDIIALLEAMTADGNVVPDARTAPAQHLDGEQRRPPRSQQQHFLNAVSGFSHASRDDHRCDPQDDRLRLSRRNKRIARIASPRISPISFRQR